MVIGCRENRQPLARRVFPRPQLGYLARPGLHGSRPGKFVAVDLRATADGEVMYSISATVVAALVAAGILWWLKSLPYHHTAEERLQEALDHQTGPLAAKPAI
jgi:hypothetical protein